MPTFFRLGSATLFLLAAGCGGSGGDSPTALPAPTSVATVIVTPASATPTVGEVVQLSAVTRDAAGGTLTGRVVGWSSSDTARAAVSATGLVTTRRGGTVTIMASSEGKVGTATLTIQDVPVASVTVTPATDSAFLGQSVQFTATLRDGAGTVLTGRTLTWTSSDTTVATVSNTGLVRAIAAGTAKITASSGGQSGSASMRGRVNPVKPTSYENFKAIGLLPAALPFPSSTYWLYTDVVARGYGDFYHRGRTDLFTARILYDWAKPQSEAKQGEYTFWRREGDSYTADNSILVPAASTCLHPRKALVADFNMDGRPDIFLACHGYDADPFPGERNQVILSGSDGRYTVSLATPAGNCAYKTATAPCDVGFWHAASAADLNGDGYPDVIAYSGNYPGVVYLNDGHGHFTLEAPGRLPAHDYSGIFATELVDVNEDGLVDLITGGNEYVTSPNVPVATTNIYLNPGNGRFNAVTPVVIPGVANEHVVLDFAVTGTGATRRVWVDRTSGGDGTYYQSRVLQRFDWATRTASTVIAVRPDAWIPWIIPYTRNGVQYIGSDDPRTPLEYGVP